MNDTRTRYLVLSGTLLLGLAVRLGLAHVANDIIDVQNFQRVAETISQDGLFALYVKTPGQYPYPPLWVWFILVARWLSTHGVIRFSQAIRLPGILADLGIVYVCWRWWHPQQRNRAWAVAIFYALNPVSLIITCLHGQFDALPAFLTVLALTLYAQKRFNLSAIALGIGIAAKPYPVLLLLPIVWYLPELRQRLRFVLIAGLPAALLLLPFLIHARQAVLAQVFGYQGVALLGLMTLLRAVYVSITHQHFPVNLTQSILDLSKWFFFAAYAAWTVHAARRRYPPLSWAAGILALFYSVYAGISPQYLLWILPLLLILPDRPLTWSGAYTITATLALIGFYAYAVPATIQPLALPLPTDARWLYGGAGILWWLSIMALFAWLWRSPHQPLQEGTR